MNLKFEKLSHQQEAIEKVVSLFSGNKVGSINNNIVFSNFLTLSKEEIFDNYEKNIGKQIIHNNLDFTIEMETGTGKTITYIETAIKLNKEYGFTKFIILVPSIAIKEGVLKTFEITNEYFKNEYNTNYNFFQYDSKNLSLLREFIQSNQIQFMIVTVDSFNKDNNILNIYSDSFGGIPINDLKKTRPILLIDEPQNFESQISKNAIESLDYLFSLRYSATHKNNYNSVYILDSFKAYELGLVKQIEVLSVTESKDNNNNGNPYISFNDIESSKKSITAKISVLDKNNKIIEKKVKVGFDLSSVNDIYFNYIIKEINSNELLFNNGIRITKGEKIGKNINIDLLMKSQIKETIIEHIEKEELFIDKGIKVLSLFFIDKVDNYASSDGKIRKYFIESIEELKNDEKYKKYIEKNYKDINKIHKGYFSKNKNGLLKDTKGDSAEDKETYNLIMKDKEQLLNLEEPLRFIFSHSALKEGWDNPNVFQICTLNETKSEMKKRQEIGRGLRICVDKNGKRKYDKEINRLTIIANESYESFASALQKEMIQEFGDKNIPPIKQKSKQIKIKRNENLNNPYFKELWNRINYKSFYQLKTKDKLNTHDIINFINNIEINYENKIEIIKTKALNFENSKISNYELSKTKEGNLLESNKKEKINILKVIKEISFNTGISIDNISLLLSNLKVEIKKLLFINEKDFINLLSNNINFYIETIFKEGILHYNIDNKKYDIEIFQSEIITYVEDLYETSSFSKKVLYDKIIYDSEIEKKFIEKLSINQNIKFFIKLPENFKINTLLNNKYNPDWAIVYENENNEFKTLYLIRETKSLDKNTNNPILDDSEKIKCYCGKLHFELSKSIENSEVGYKIVEIFDL